MQRVFWEVGKAFTIVERVFREVGKAVRKVLDI